MVLSLLHVLHLRVITPLVHQALVEEVIQVFMVEGSRCSTPIKPLLDRYLLSSCRPSGPLEVVLHVLHLILLVVPVPHLLN